jgi:DNA polymerase III epsilon subunit-like protein
MTTYITLDTESTGKWIKPKAGYQPARMVELAWKIDDQPTKSFLIKPTTFFIPADVNEIHDINHRMATIKGIDGRVVIQMMLDDIQKRMDDGHQVILVGHNIKMYDLPLIVAELENYGFPQCDIDLITSLTLYDTLIYSRKLLKHEVYNHKLNTIYTYITRKQIEQAHRACADVEATWIVLQFLLKIGDPLNLA